MKEIVTASIGLLIVAVTLFISWQLFRDRAAAPAWASNPLPGAQPVFYDPFQRGKDVLFLLLPLTGAIVGYYTGRVIADRTIDQANTTAEQATKTATDARETNRATQQKLRTTVLPVLEEARAALEPDRAAAAIVTDSRSLAQEKLEKAEERVRALLNQ